MRRLTLAAVLAGIWLTGCASSGRYDTPNQVGRDNTLGSPEAPVVIEEWADFQCPACRTFTRVEPELQQAVLADGGARLVFRHMPFLGQESVWAAEATECAGDQGSFWKYHDMLYASQDGENRGTFSKGHLRRFAVAVGLADQAGFNLCLDTDKYAGLVLEEKRRGERLGVNSTPTLFVNGRRVVLSNSRSPVESIRVAVQNASSR